MHRVSSLEALLLEITRNCYVSGILHKKSQFDRFLACTSRLRTRMTRIRCELGRPNLLRMSCSGVLGHSFSVWNGWQQSLYALPDSQTHKSSPDCGILLKGPSGTLPKPLKAGAFAAMHTAGCLVSRIRMVESSETGPVGLVPVIPCTSTATYDFVNENALANL